MASLFAVGLPFTYDGTTNHFATTTGGTATVAAVTSADTVTVDTNSGNATLTIGAAFSCSALTINNSSSTVACDATHGITATGAVTLTTGTLNTNAQTCTWGSFSSSNAAARILTITNSNITVNSSTGSVSWDMANATNATVNATGSTITMTQGGANITWREANTAGSGHTWGTLAFTGSGSPVITAPTSTFANITRTGTAVSGDTFNINSALNVSGTLTLTGNSTTNRLLVQSSALGTNRTVTVATTVTASNADFMDITGAGAASWDLSAITGLSGDCGGNSSITFTTPVTLFGRFAANSSSTWGAAASWSLTSGGGATGRTPLPQDSVKLDANSFNASFHTVTIGLPRASKDIDFTGATNAPTLSLSTSCSFFGSLTLISGMSLSGVVTTTFAGRGTHTINLAGITWPHTTIFNSVGGSYSLQGDYLSSASMTQNWGSLDAVSFNIRCTTFGSSNSNIRSLKMGSGTWSMTSVTASATVWTLSTTTNLTFDAGTSTLTHTGTTGSVITLNWALANLTYNNISLSTAQTTITHSFAGGATINGTYTQIPGNISTWTTTPVVLQNAPVISGTAGNLVTITGSQGPANPAHFRVGASSATPYSLDYLSLTDVHGDTSAGALGTGLWYAGANSVDGGDNTGWIFANPSSFFLLF